MHILLVNDDGYNSAGIVLLAKALSKNNRIIVVAPHKCNSGMSHATTFNKTIYVEEITSFPYLCYSITGTPSDCVKIGLELLSGDKPDLVISGINTDYNIGTDVVYSGTANAALEATLSGIPAIAVSTKILEEDDFEYVVDFFVNNFLFYKQIISEDYTLNININRKQLGNLSHKITPLGKRNFSDIYLIDHYAPKGVAYTLIGNPIKINNSEDCDVEWIMKGYATITPLSVDLTSQWALELISSKYQGDIN